MAGKRDPLHPNLVLNGSDGRLNDPSVLSIDLSTTAPFSVPKPLPRSSKFWGVSRVSMYLFR